MQQTGDANGARERKFEIRKTGQLALMRGVIAIAILVMQDQLQVSIFIIVQAGLVTAFAFPESSLLRNRYCELRSTREKLLETQRRTR
jgi:hypothetical protein